MSLNALRDKLAKIAKAIGLNAVALKLLQDRHARRHKKAAKAYNKSVKALQKATDLRREGKLAAAKVWDQRATKAKLHSEAMSNQARKLVGPIKARVQRAHDLDVSHDRLKARIKKVTGGGPEHRLQKTALESAAACASGRRHNFYSQTGAWDIEHCVSGPVYGHRDDCSSWFTSVYWACKLPDPNDSHYGSGYTGTLVAGGHQISIEEARHTPGAAIIYGSGAGHHVEFAIGDGTDHTIGHGSAPVDMGVFNLFGDGQYRCFKYPTS